MRTETPKVLLVEDNQGDVAFMKMVIKELFPSAIIENYDNGESAMEYFRSEAETSMTDMPNLILLDWNLPSIEGIEILKYLKGESNYSTIPVIVLSSSDYDRDILDAYKASANGYVSKTTDFEQYRNDLKVLFAYWLTVNQSPSQVYHDR